MFKLPKLGKHLYDKVLFVLLLIGIVPLIILGIISLYNLDLFHRADVASIENNLLNQKAEEIISFVRNISDSFKIQVGFEQVSDIEHSSQIFLLQGLLEEFPALEEVSFLNLLGKETSRLSKYNLGGVSEYELQDQARIEKFKKAIQGELYIGPVYYTLNGPMMTLSSPVVNKNGVIISVLAGEFNLKKLEEIVTKSHLGSTGYVYIVDRDGFLIAHGQPVKNSLLSLKSIKFIDGVLSGEESSNTSNRYESLWGESVVAEGKYLSDLGFAVIAEWPTQDADQVVTTARNQIVVAIILVLVSTLLFSILFTNRIVQPIKILEKGARLIAGGKFDQPINIKTGDEIEELSLAFNDMMTGLKRLEELEKEFVFIAAHDLRTPVSVIKGYLSLVMDGSYGQVEPSVKVILEKVAKANQRLVQLVNDLLQVARAEAGRIPIKVASVSVVEPIKEIIAELKSLADKKQISLIYEPSANVPNVLADSERLKELMVNLISNSIKYTFNSGIVTISHEIKDSMLFTHIKDTGMGISLENQKRLFEKYYRIENENTKDIEGTGLGLFIVKQIVEKMNGTIWVTSEEGKGSTFSFSLPIV